jgi:hypothetical protein
MGVRVKVRVKVRAMVGVRAKGQSICCTESNK